MGNKRSRACYTLAMASSRAPGDGADRPAHHSSHGGYVYVARSRRSGGLSLGVDLTPHGHCSFSCIYCQASHPCGAQPDLRVNLDRLRDDLLAQLESPHATELRDLVLAGSGEPSGAVGFPEALALIEQVCRRCGFDRPRRVFTNGRHLRSDAVSAALARWIDSGGEAWFKLDGASDEVLRAINGREIDARSHLAAIWAFARERGIGIQSMLVQGEGLPDVDGVVAGIIEEIATAVASGAKVTAVHLLTLARRPSDEDQAARLRAIPAQRLEEFASMLRTRTRLPVSVYGAT